MADTAVAEVEAKDTTASEQATTGDATGSNGGQEPAKTFTQADVDRILAERLSRAEAKTKEATAKAQAEAERKAAEEQGKWKELYEQTKTQAEQARQEAATIRLTALRERIARTILGSDALAARLQGDDEDSITADAKALAKLMPKPTAPNINAGPGNGAAPVAGQMTDAEKAELAAIYGVNPRYFAGN
jgi:hypothetical protein